MKMQLFGNDINFSSSRVLVSDNCKQEVKVIWQKAPHGGPIPRLGVTSGVESCTIEFLG